MNRVKFLSLLLVTAAAAGTVSGCSVGRDKEALRFSEKYLMDVLDVDLFEMREKLKDEDGIKDYEAKFRDVQVLTKIFGDCEYEQTEYKREGKEITVGYTLYIPDFEEFEDEEYDSFEELIESIRDLDETEYEIEFTLVQKGSKWYIEDAKSALDLYEDIVKSISKAEIDYDFGYEAALEVVSRYCPDLAAELMNTSGETDNQGMTYEVNVDGIQIIVDEFNDEDDCYLLFSNLVEAWCGDDLSRYETIYYFNANGNASGAVRSGNVLIQVYDRTGTNGEAVNDMLEDLHEYV